MGKKIYLRYIVYESNHFLLITETIQFSLIALDFVKLDLL